MAHAEIRAQREMRHADAQVLNYKVANLGYRRSGVQKPILGIKVFHGGPQQAMNEYVYQILFGFMRCNISQDSQLLEGVYAWADVQSALRSIELEKAVDRTKCLGIVEGYLKRRSEDKICLNPKSTKLIAIFAPWDEEIHLPFELGAEDTLAFGFPLISWEDL